MTVTGTCMINSTFKRLWWLALCYKYNTNQRDNAFKSNVNFLRSWCSILGTSNLGPIYTCLWYELWSREITITLFFFLWQHHHTVSVIYAIWNGLWQGSQLMTKLKLLLLETQVSFENVSTYERVIKGTKILVRISSDSTTLLFFNWYVKLGSE